MSVKRLIELYEKQLDGLVSVMETAITSALKGHVTGDNCEVVIVAMTKKTEEIDSHMLALRNEIEELKVKFEIIE